MLVFELDARGRQSEHSREQWTWSSTSVDATSLTSMSAGDEHPEEHMQTAESGGHNPVCPACGQSQCNISYERETYSHHRNHPNRKCSAGDYRYPVKHEPHSRKHCIQMLLHHDQG